MAGIEKVPETPEGSVEATGDAEKASEKEKTKKGESEPPVSEHEGSGEDGEDGEDEDEEYEIEKIINARKGHFENGEFGYLVKWKGYGEEHNSWVRESDAGNATELIDVYWKTKKEAASKRQSATARGRQSLKNKDKSKSPGAETTTSKRGRGKSNAKSVSDDEQEDSEIEQQKKKKKRLNTPAGASSSKGGALNGSNGTKKRSSLAALNKTDDDVSMVDYSAVGTENLAEDKTFTTMKALKYNAIKSWEDLVKNISTVERNPKDELVVYFETTDGKLVREPSSVCRRRFPNKLLDFYESHLRWKASEDEQTGEPQ